MVNFYANNLWGQLSRHSDAKNDPEFLALVPKWLEVACKKLVKVGFPSKSDSAACAFSKLDFETDEEFTSQFGKCRIIMLDTVKTLSSIDPTVPYQVKRTFSIFIGNLDVTNFERDPIKTVSCQDQNILYEQNICLLVSLLLLLVSHSS